MALTQEERVVRIRNATIVLEIEIGVVGIEAPRGTTSNAKGIAMARTEAIAEVKAAVVINFAVPGRLCEASGYLSQGKLTRLLH